MNRRFVRMLFLGAVLAVPAVRLDARVGAAGAATEPPTPTAINPHGEMKLDCRLCHSDQGGAVEAGIVPFDHAATGFALEGQHALVACRDCHKQPRFSHIGVRCADCHLDAHKNRLGPDCEQCHTPAGWIERTQAQRAHDTTRLPLVGAHARVDCDACHVGAQSGEYLGTPADCFACHAPDYEATREPDHRAAGFGTDCDRCHGVFSAAWGGGDFIHAASFPLTGAHATAACASCHETTFAGTPTDCFACHQPDYDGTADPPHATAGLGTACASCHGTADWRPSTYDHAQPPANYALQGAHRGVDCASCHVAGYVATPTDCYACHQADYTQTNDPSHSAASFPTTCATCHSTTAWTPATWDHEQLFPIESGAHRNLSCAECHVTPGNYAHFECILCHEHNQADMARDHEGQANYQWVSAACYACHPDGRH